MNTGAAFLCGLAVSIMGIAYLLSIDEKRRRVFRAGSASNLPRFKFGGWALVLLPALALISAGQISAFLAWFGAVTVCAWLIVSRAPLKRQD